MQEFLQKITAVFADFNIVDALEIFLFALVFYYVFRILKMSNVRHVIAIISILVLATGTVFLFSENINNQIYFIVPLVLVGWILMTFNVEVKRDILSMNTFVNYTELAKHQTTASKDEVERYIGDIIKALQNMSKDNIGALIILSNDNLPRQVLDSGVTLDANISTQLIEGIFFPKAPLHDGAMVINNYKVQAAGCFLPLTQNVNIPKELGTRHRAGIGITETSNVIALIVSEDTGIITIAQRGKISRYADYDLLRKTLNDYYWKDLSADGRKKL